MISRNGRRSGRTRRRRPIRGWGSRAALGRAPALAATGPGPKIAQHRLERWHAEADPDRPGAEPARAGRRPGSTTPEPGRAQAERRAASRSAALEASPEPERPEDELAQPDRRRRDQRRRPATIGSRCGRFSTWLSSSSAWPRYDCSNRTPGHDLGQGLRQEHPAADAVAPMLLDVRQRLDQEPAEPGQLEHGQDQDQRAPARSRRRVGAGGRRSAHSVGPMLHGANSSSPTPLRSLLVCWPLATSRITSKIRRPTLSTGSPSRIAPAFDVHVVDHPLVHRRVGRHLDGRRRLAARARCRGRS